ncbi:hypothetical protein A3860_11645 [Niastella vici]|uniref:Fibronectin type-III domain-containing protein n=1 Tax=Niastella vici TaxID=1703345 RepID=A0A1V9FG72_9BACT|nr:hypothetical protein [Niastella vici]OQP57206.1 hypothetical protein A3860_11645 [Niastella vici]
MKLKIKSSYRKGSDTYLLVLTNRIKESLKENAYFPKPTPELSVLEKAFLDFQAAKSVSGRNDMTLSSAKNDRKAELIGILDDLAGYITTTSNGDRTMLLSSGFDIAGIKAASQNLGQIEKLEVEIGPPGQAITRIKKVAGAKAYIHQCTPDPITSDSEWTSETIVESENTFTNLKSIAKYWFRVIAIGKGKQTVHSVLVSKVIQ